ncbi:MAG: hypothetical protein ACKVTZ_11815 [Bacteroidia bacterium]
MKKINLLFSFSFTLSSLFAQNVGIGTAVPASKLEVMGIDASSLSSVLHLKNQSNASLLFVNNAGNVGIGINTGLLAATRLHVMNMDWGLATPISIFESHNCGGNCAQTEGSTIALVNNNPNGAYMGSLTFAEAGAYDIPSAAIFGTDRNVALNRAGLAFFTRNASNYAERMRLDQAGRLGIGTSAPDDRLDVVGNAQVSGYLKVGNPAAPTGTMDLIELLDWNGNTNFFVDYSCGANNWTITTGTNTYLYYNNPGSRSRHRTKSAWFWVPSNAYNFQLSLVMDSNLENTFDGTFLEIATSDNPNTYYKVSSFFLDGYNNTAVGSNTNCNGNNTQNAWTGGLGFRNPRSSNMPVSVYGKWMRVGLVGMSDASNGSGEARVYAVGAFCNLNNPLGGVFNAGSIYAQGNVYAGRNVLLGDLAEYFKVRETSEPGDVIALSATQNDSYTVSAEKENPRVIGVHSTDPTLTLNKAEGVPVALAGRVPVKVCDENGKVAVGDYLTAASKQGYAMKATRNCYVLGKALENLTEKEGKILCLVQGAWYNVNDASRTQSTGSFFIPAGKAKIVVQDENMLPTSRIFVSLLNNSGTTHWIGKKEAGSFEICFGEALKNEVSFDYLVDNAHNKVEKGNENEAVKAFLPDQIVEEQIELPLDNGFVPPMPPDPTKFYRLDAQHNLIEYHPNITQLPDDSFKSPEEWQAWKQAH